jgi:hypothetical protein
LRRLLEIRALIAVLIGGLVCGSSGCVAGERRANRFQNRVSEGMTREEVEEALGEADSHRTVKGREIWHYAYGPLPDPQKIAVASLQTLGILTVLGACLLQPAYGNHSGSNVPTPTVDRVWPSGDGSSSSRTVHFRVVFGQTGRVVEISGIESCDEEDP